MHQHQQTPTRHFKLKRISRTQTGAILTDAVKFAYSYLAIPMCKNIGDISCTMVKNVANKQKSILRTQQGDKKSNNMHSNGQNRKWNLVGIVVADANTHVGKSPSQVASVVRWHECFVLLDGKDGVSVSLDDLTHGTLQLYTASSKATLPIHHEHTNTVMFEIQYSSNHKVHGRVLKLPFYAGHLSLAITSAYTCTLAQTRHMTDWRLTAFTWSLAVASAV